jgi:lipopolysaccharide transport system ATP-binding protein
MCTVITVENLGKKYTLHHQQREQYTALRDFIADGFKGVGRRFASVFYLSLFTIHCSQRVASLLEVGTGFHPELTGRENIFLNGTILGMGRVEIRK